MATRYWETPDGKIWGGNTIILDGRTVFNPTREQLLAAGYREREVEPYVPTLEDNKRDVLAKLEQYVRDKVERFTVNGRAMWLGTARRTELAQLLETLSRQGFETATVWLDEETAVNAKVSQLRQMTDDLAVYCGIADNATHAHRAAINAAATADEVAAHDITSGYTKTLTFDF